MMKPVFQNHFHYALWLDVVRNTFILFAHVFPPSTLRAPCSFLYYICEETYTELVVSNGQLDYRKLLYAHMNDCAVGSIFAIDPHLRFSIRERLYKEAASPVQVHSEVPRGLLSAAMNLSAYVGFAP